jgi:hypothetical protein
MHVTYAHALAFACMATTTQAASPPPSWTNLRVIECDGVELTTYLAPPGFGTPFNIVGSTDVIVPMFVQVTIEGAVFTTKDVPGFDANGADVISCSYVDPAGILVEFLGIRK